MSECAYLIKQFLLRHENENGFQRDKTFHFKNSLCQHELPERVEYIIGELFPSCRVISEPLGLTVKCKRTRIYNGL
jgi:hypothetical protein